MGYDGPRLSALFDEETERSFDRICREIVDDGAEHMTTNIRALTPIGHDPWREAYIPGHLRESIRKKIVTVTIRARGLVYESGTETDVLYAPYVEHGTGLWGPRRAKYEIRPKNPDGWLRFHDRETGRVIFAKRVMHPGSPGAHMFARGVALTEEQFKVLAEERLDRAIRDEELRWRVVARVERIRS